MGPHASVLARAALGKRWEARPRNTSPLTGGRSRHGLGTLWDKGGFHGTRGGRPAPTAPPHGDKELGSSADSSSTNATARPSTRERDPARRRRDLAALAARSCPPLGRRASIPLGRIVLTGTGSPGSRACMSSRRPTPTIRLLLRAARESTSRCAAGAAIASRGEVTQWC